MATAVLFMYDPATGKTNTDVFDTKDYVDPIRIAERLRDSCVDDFPGALWAISGDDEAREIIKNTRMREMGLNV